MENFKVQDVRCFFGGDSSESELMLVVELLLLLLADSTKTGLLDAIGKIGGLHGCMPRGLCKKKEEEKS
jgi:hypothetical protein